MRRLVLAAVALLAAACEGRSRPEGATEAPKRFGPAIAVVDLSSGAPEQEKPGLFGAAGPRKSFDELLRVTGELAADDTRGVMVKIGSAAIGSARAEEIGEALARVRAKKPVTCHADGLTNATLMMAAQGCSTLWLSPAGEVAAIGIAAQIVYLRRLLVDELHLSIDMQQVGKYKGAEEPLTRDGPSPEAKASLMGVLGDLRAAWTETLGAARPAVPPPVFEDGPWSPRRAKELGLVDEVGYADDAALALRQKSGAVRERVVFGAGAEEQGGDLDDVVRSLAGEGAGAGPIALVRATGSIAMTAGGNGLLGGSGGILEKELGRTLARLEKDDEVKAVVVRIDSPGGSALASDLLWHRLMKLRAKKPVVFSVGDMAASGGYYLASSADFIFAEPMSIVGSIGVVGGKIGGGDALERIGVHAETFAASPREGAVARAAYESPLVKWDEATKARVLESMTGVYELFLARVAEGRSTRGRTVTRDQVDANAEGKIFSGREGKRLGLVDELGGLGAAIERARELAHLGASARVVPVTAKPGFLEALDPTAAAEAAVSPVGIASRFAPDIVPFVTSLAPLGAGERIVLSLPFALKVE